MEDIEDKTIELDDYTENLIETRASLKAEIDERNKRVKSLEQQIKEKLANNLFGKGQRFKISFKPQPRTNFHYKELLKDHPEFENFKETKYNKVLRISEVK